MNDLELCHRAHVLFPRRCEDGSLTFGDVWRKWTPKGWVYERIDETDEEWWERQV